MTSFLFWNLMGGQRATWAERRGRLRASITRLATLGIDVFILAESGFSPVELTAALEGAQGGPYTFPASNSRRIQIYTRLPATAVVDQFNDSSDGRLTIRRLTTPGNTDVLLAAIHFQSQLHWSRQAQGMLATVLARDLADTEDVVGHRRTILVGDLNMNPFDFGVIDPHGLNAVMVQDVARASERIVAGRPFRFFYNPMWGHFGDRTPGPPGTYYHGPASPEAYYWNLFDQVLLRPDLMTTLTELRILDHDGTEPLVTGKGRPRSAELSDHLPVLFRLNL